jgi:hypothetical protein
MATMVALAMASAALSAHAAPSDLFAPQDDFTPKPNQIGPPAPHKTLQWDSRKGRWGLNLELAQPGDRDVQGRDTRVGVTYRIAPGLHTGVGVALGSAETPDGRRIDNDASAPRVQLETSFKF